MSHTQPTVPSASPLGADDIRHPSGPPADETRPANPLRHYTRSTLLGDSVSALLGVVAGILSPAVVERSLKAAREGGQYAVLAGGGLTLLYAIFAAIKYNSFAIFLTGLGLIAAIAVAQFAATRFLAAGVQTIAHTPSRISSPAFLECTGLLLLILAVSLLIGGLVAAIQLGSIAPLLPVLLITAALTYFGAVALHPTLVNISVGATSAGEEAIGLMSFFFKAVLKLVPLFFCLLAVAGGLAIIASFFESGRIFASSIASVLHAVPFPIPAPHGLAGAGVVLLACLLPLAAYFFFLLQYLLLDVLRAILSIPMNVERDRSRNAALQNNE